MIREIIEAVIKFIELWVSNGNLFFLIFKFYKMLNREIFGYSANFSAEKKNRGRGNIPLFLGVSAPPPLKKPPGKDNKQKTKIRILN